MTEPLASYTMHYSPTLEGGYVGAIEEVTGVFAQGDTIEELRLNLIASVWYMLYE